MPRLMFSVLGPVEVRLDGAAIELGARPRTLLAALLVRAGHWVSVDQLVDDLWGEAPPDPALPALHTYVSRLRKALEPQRRPREASTVIASRPGAYRLEVEAGALDSFEFERLLAEGRHDIARGHHAAAHASLTEALDLWRGHAYDDLAYEAFLQAEIARLTELRLLAEESRVEAALALGHDADLVPELERLVAEHPLRERLRGHLMLALYRTGRQTDALRLYQAFRTLLVEEIGVEPGPELQHLERAILDQDPALGAAPPADVHAEAPARRARPSIALAGRDREAALLAAAVDGLVNRGEGRYVAIAGEAGIGKTRLIDEVASRAEEGGALFVRASAIDDGDQPPFWSWTQIVRALVASVGRERVLEAAGGLRSELPRVVPELGTAPGLPADARQARFRTADAVAAVVSSLAETVPMVVAIDDAHAADDDSVRVLTMLARSAPTARVVVLLAYRDELLESQSLAPLLAELTRSVALERIVLRPLDAAATARLVREVAGDEHIDAELVVGCAEGNPFFAVELARLLVVRKACDCATAVPAAVRDVVRERVRRLGDGVANLLRAAAVTGREFDFDVVAEVAGLDTNAAVEAFEDAMEAGVVVAADASRRLRFAHGLVQATLASDLTDVRRSLLHARAAAAIERRYARDATRFAELARHARASVPVAAPASVLRQMKKAALDAASLLAFDQARSLHEERLVMVSSLADDDARAREELDVLVDLLAVSTWVRGYHAHEIDELVARALALCDRVPDAPAVVGALWSRWAYHALRAEFDGARAVCDELAEVERRTGTPAAGFAASFTRGVLEWHLGELDAAAASLELAASHLDALDGHEPSRIMPGDPRVARDAFFAFVSALRGEQALGDVVAARAVQTARAAGDEFSLSFALLFEAAVAIAADDPVRAGAPVQEAIDIAQRGGFVHNRLVGTVYRGWVEARAGGGRHAADEAAVAAEELASLGAVGIRHFLLGLVADAYLSAGDAAEAARLADLAIDDACATSERFWVPRVRQVRQRASLVLDRNETSEGALLVS